jgi:hypothetical protein
MARKKQLGSVELIIIAVVAAVLLIGYGIIRYQHKENQKLVEQNATQKVTIGTQNETIERDKKSDVVNEQTNVQVDASTKDVQKKQGKAAADTQAQVDAIVRDAKAKAATAKSEEERKQVETKRINDVAAARIDGLWTSYCLVAPQAEGCVAAK